MSKTPAPSPIGLTDLIYQVKRELLSGGSHADDPVPLFAVEEIQVEVAVAVSRSGEGGINIQVFSIDAGVSKEDTQTVRVTLSPLRTRQELVSDLRTGDPESYQKMIKESEKILKGLESPDDPMHWP
jgi:hypothetical protein